MEDFSLNMLIKRGLIKKRSVPQLISPLIDGIWMKVQIGASNIQEAL